MTSFSLASIKNTFDEVRAQVYPKNETEKKVYEALSSKNWGASSTLMNDIAAETYDFEKYNIIMNLLWSNIEGEGRTWKHIFKALTLLEFLVKNGSERVIEASRDKMYRIRNLQDYNFYEGTIDKGSGVREKSKQIVELLGSNEQIRTEREKARQLRNKFVGISNDAGGFGNNRGFDSFGRDNFSSREKDSYSSNNNNSYSDRDRDIHSSSTTNGGGRYSDSYDTYNSKDTPSYSNSNRYGGGAYDSSRPTRYEDEVSEKFPEITDKLASPFEDNRPIDRSSRLDPPKSIGGKLKVNIKKSVDSSTSLTSKAAEVDLFDTSDSSFSSAPPPVPVSHKSNQNDLFFDPFESNAPVTSHPAPARAPAPVTNLFDDSFNTVPAPAPQIPTNSNNFNAFPNQGNFDPFANQSFPQQTFTQPVSQPYSQPISQPVNPAFNQPYSQPYTNNNQFNNQPDIFGSNFSAPAPAPVPIATQPIYYTQPPNQKPIDHDFGDFESANKSTSNNINTTNGLDKWKDMSKLIDLTSIAKNDDLSKKSNPSSNVSANISQNSFAGLDGFVKSSQPMIGSSLRPAQSLQPAMTVRQPVSNAPIANANFQPSYPNQQPLSGYPPQPGYGYPPNQPPYPPQVQPGYGYPQPGYLQQPPAYPPQGNAIYGAPRGYPQQQQGAPFGF